MTLRELAREGEKCLRESQIEDARREARLLLLDAFGIGSSEYILYGETEITSVFPEKNGRDPKCCEEHYRRQISDRAARIPLPYLTGTADFMGLTFCVSKDTLCPRPDTEILAEQVLKDHGGEEADLLDLCTGTGCIGISLAVFGAFRRVDLSDLSEAALKTAALNVSRLASGKNIGLYQGDLFQALPAGEKYDIITANPPYIREAVIETLEPEVRVYEPRLALSGGEDGLCFYRRILSEAPRYLNRKNGAVPSLYLEIGYDQEKEVAELMEEAGFTGITAFRDLGGNPRVLRGVLAAGKPEAGDFASRTREQTVFSHRESEDKICRF